MDATTDFMKQLIGFLFWALLACTFINAQTTTGLVAYYPLDSTLGDATGNTANAGFPVGSIDYSCGIFGEALRLDGVNDEVRFSSGVSREFDTEDFTLSMYLKNTGGQGTQYLFSKRWVDCRTDNVFDLRYQPASNSINLFAAESSSKLVSLTKELDPGKCWNHVSVWRRGPEFRLYVNGELVDSRKTTSRIDLFTPSDSTILLVGGSNCLSPNERRFNGLIDDIRLYNRALSEAELDGLYEAPDEILTPDTLIFSGESVNIRVSNTCADNFFWEPTTGVFSSFEAEPRITPAGLGQITYTLNFEDAFVCIARDSIQITVIDPDELNCNEIFLPNAFTPNGDGLNDRYGISNPFAIPQLISFEIYDRWGERVFFTNNPFDSWDGSFRGQELNSGVMIYKVRYFCEGEEKVITGSITMMR